MRKLIVADAVSTTDIEQIVLAVNKSNFNILPVGTVACAQVVGNNWLPEMKNQHIAKKIPQLPKFIVSGSATQITANQIEKLENSDEFDNILTISFDLKTVLERFSLRSIGSMPEVRNRKAESVAFNVLIIK